MGQRLNISIEKNGEVLANAYYHWSAFTKPALELTKNILSVYKQVPITSSDIELAVRLLESTGAGINLAEHERILSDKRFYPDEYKPNYTPMQFLTCSDRNCGIISVTPEGIKETEKWEEARVTIDIENEIVWFSVFYEYKLDDFVLEFADELSHDGIYSHIKDYDFDISDAISFTDFQKLEAAVNDNPNGFIYDGFAYLWVQ